MSVATKASANTGVEQRRCRVCTRGDSLKVTVVASADDWVVVLIECGHCGVKADSVVGERGERARVLLETRPNAKQQLFRERGITA